MHKYSRGWLAAIMIGAVAAGCTADVEDPGEAPEVNIEEGRAPEIDVDPADVDISTDTQTVRVPDVDIDAQEP